MTDSVGRRDDDRFPVLPENDKLAGLVVGPLPRAEEGRRVLEQTCSQGRPREGVERVAEVERRDVCVRAREVSGERKLKSARDQLDSALCAHTKQGLGLGFHWACYMRRESADVCSNGKRGTGDGWTQSRRQRTGHAREVERGREAE